MLLTCSPVTVTQDQSRGHSRVLCTERLFTPADTAIENVDLCPGPQSPEELQPSSLSASRAAPGQRLMKRDGAVCQDSAGLALHPPSNPSLLLDPQQGWVLLEPEMDCQTKGVASSKHCLACP